MLWLYAVLAVFIGKFALRGNTLFPERAARRKIARRNPTLGLANHEHPLSEFDRRLIVLRDAIFHVGAIALAGRRTEVERVERETRMAGFFLLIVKIEGPLDVARLRTRLSTAPSKTGAWDVPKGRTDSVTPAEGNDASCSPISSRQDKEPPRSSSGQ